MPQSPSILGSGIVTFTVSSNGQSVDSTVRVISITVQKRINMIPVAHIVLADGDMPQQDFPLSNSDDFKPGATIKIDAGYGQEEATIFEGIVIKHGVSISGNNLSKLVVECRDKAVGMTIDRRNANYVDLKDSDIITKLIGNSGLSSDVTATTTSFGELVQYYCTDWDFMLARAEVNGMLVLVEAGKVTVEEPDTDTKPKLKVTYGEELMEFEAHVDARGQLASVKSVSWDPRTQAAIEDEATPTTLNEQGDLDSKTLAKVVGPTSYRMQTSATLAKGTLKSWAEARQVKAGLARIRGRMKFQGSAMASLGKLIELEGVGNRLSGKVFVSSVRHRIAAGDWFTEVEFGLTPEWFTERHDVAAPLASGWSAGVRGLHIGVVKKLDANPDGEPMIQVSVPVLQAETEGVWARLTKFYGSDGVGAFFVPEIGDEVILGYLNGDPSSPVILGSVYSSKRKPPYELTAENNTKAIVTKSELRVEFDDEKKVISITTPAENKIVISDDGKSILLEDQNNNKAELSASGIVLDSPKDISISAKGKITLNAVGEVSISSKADVKTAGLNINNTANVGFVAKGNATAELSASGQTTVKGAMVMIN